MTVVKGIPYCDECHGELIAMTPEQAENHLFACGWSNYKTAKKHFCQDCYDSLFEKWAKAVGFPACGECETFPCKRGRDCWDNRSPPLHWFPYESFFGELIGSSFPVDDDFDSEDPIEPEIVHWQKLQQAAHQKCQTRLLEVTE